MKKIEKLKLQLFNPIFCQKIEILTKAIVFIILGIVSITGCRVYKEIPVESRTEIHYIDSTIIHRDTISIEIPREVIKEVVYADSSHLETNLAASTALVDSCGYLHHTLENKAGNALKKEILWKEKIQYKDSIKFIEKPVPVERIKYKTPEWAWYSLGFSVLCLLGIGLFFGLRLKP